MTYNKAKLLFERRRNKSTDKRWLTKKVFIQRNPYNSNLDSFYYTVSYYKDVDRSIPLFSVFLNNNITIHTITRSFFLTNPIMKLIPYLVMCQIAEKYVFVHKKTGEIELMENVREMNEEGFIKIKENNEFRRRIRYNNWKWWKHRINHYRNYSKLAKEVL